MNFPDPASIKISLSFDILESVLCLVMRRRSLISQHLSLFWKAPDSLLFPPSLGTYSSLTWSRWEPPITTTQSTGPRGRWWPALDLPCASTFWDLKERDTPSLVSRLGTWVWEHEDLSEEAYEKTCWQQQKSKLEERPKPIWVPVSRDPGDPVISFCLVLVLFLLLVYKES